MFKKIIFILIIVGIITAGAFGWWTYIRNSGMTSGETFSFGDFFPFGNSNDVVVPTENANPETNASSTESVQPTTPIVIPVLRKISQEPVSGAVVVNVSTGSPAVRFIYKATGNMFESSLSQIGIKRISNTTIPKIAETKWVSGGAGVVLRYINDDDSIQSLYATLRGSTTTESGETLQELGGTFLPTNIANLAVLNGRDKVVFIESTGSIYTSNADGSKKTALYSSGITEWNIEWPKEDTVLITTKPSSGISGFLYSINTKTGAFRKILGDTDGLTTKSDSQTNHILYSTSKGKNIVLYSLDTKSGTTTNLGPKTLSEKCVWAQNETGVAYCAVPTTIPNGIYPDDWYQGVVSFTDSIWKINTITGETNLIADLTKLSNPNQNIDAINLSTDSRDSFLIFTNKKDDSLWSLTLSK